MVKMPRRSCDHCNSTGKRLFRNGIDEVFIDCEDCQPDEELSPEELEAYETARDIEFKLGMA